MHFIERRLTVGVNDRIYFTLPVDSKRFPKSSEGVSFKIILLFEQQLEYLTATRGRYM